MSSGKTMALVAVVVLSAATVFGQPAKQPATEWFEDATAAVGVGFLHDPGLTGKYFMPESIGSGAALFDADNDGRLDLYLIQNSGDNSKSPNRLFLQSSDGKFRDNSRGSGVDVTGRGMGVAAGDVNNDGRIDLFVTEYGRSRLFLNSGDRTFIDVSKAAGIDNPQWGVSAAMFDFDRDGWLDIVAVNYVNYDSNRPCQDSAGRREYCGPNAFPGTVTRLFRNTTAASRRVNPGGSPASNPQSPTPNPHRHPSFDDVTISSGLAKTPGNGLGVYCGDFDGDRWMDLLIANDGQQNHLWINRRDGTFAEEALLRGIALNAMGSPEANMGVAVGDVNADGLFDIFVTHLTDETHTLWAQGPRGFFRDQTVMAGLARPKWRSTGFGTVFADFDHDGHLDLALVNGRVKRDQTTDVQRAAMKTLGPHWGLYAERNQLFAGGPQGRFRDVSQENSVFSGTARVARGIAVGDIDNDGDLDLVVTFIADRARIYRNVAPKSGHWLMVRAVDPALGRDAYGAEITVRAAGKSWSRWANPGYSYACSNDPRAHFGLGSAARIDALEVIWPDGAAESFSGGAVDRQLEIRKGQGTAKKP